MTKQSTGRPIRGFAPCGRPVTIAVKLQRFILGELALTARKIARRVFEAALKAELAEVMVDFKAKAAAASETDDIMWSIQEHLFHTRRRSPARRSGVHQSEPVTK